MKTTRPDPQMRLACSSPAIRDDKVNHQVLTVASGFFSRLLEGFKTAVDYWFPKMDPSAKCEAIKYAIAKSGVKTLYTNEGEVTQVPAQMGAAA